MEDLDHLTDKQRRYVENISRGMDSRAAARAAGYSESFSRVAAHRLGKKHAVAAAIEAIRAEGRKVAVFGLVEAMKEADDAAAFARLHKVPMAVVKATELRAKLSGLLIDRVEIAHVDLSGALARAEQRVLNVTPGVSGRSVCWAPRTPGDPVAEDPEAGVADGQVRS